MGNTLKFELAPNTDGWVADKIKQKYNIDDATFNRLQKLALSLGMQETSFGSRIYTNNNKRDRQFIISGAKLGSRFVHGLFGRDMSKGFPYQIL